MCLILYFHYFLQFFPSLPTLSTAAPPETTGRFFSNSRCARVRLEAGRDQRNSTAQFIVDSIHHHPATTQRRGTTDTNRHYTKTAMNGHNSNHDESVSIPSSWRWPNTGLMRRQVWLGPGRHGIFGPRRLRATGEGAMGSSERGEHDSALGEPIGSGMLLLLLPLPRQHPCRCLCQTLGSNVKTRCKT